MIWSKFILNKSRKLESDIVLDPSAHKPQRGHHFGAARCETRRQRPGCRTFPDPTVECCTVHTYCFRKPLLCHHFGEAGCVGIQTREIPLQGIAHLLSVWITKSWTLMIFRCQGGSAPLHSSIQVRTMFFCDSTRHPHRKPRQYHSYKGPVERGSRTGQEVDTGTCQQTLGWVKSHETTMRLWGIAIHSPALLGYLQ